MVACPSLISISDMLVTRKFEYGQSVVKDVGLNEWIKFNGFTDKK